MRYTHFQVNNYKGIASLSLDLDKPPRHPVFTLVGLNESGKTTILEAIHWFNSSEAHEPHDLIPKSQRANFNDEISVATQIALNERDREEIRNRLGRLDLVPTLIPDHVQVRRAFHYANSKVDKEEVIWKTGIRARKKKGKKERDLTHYEAERDRLIDYMTTKMLPPVVYYENFLFNVPDKIYLEKADGALSPIQRKYREVVQDVLNSLNMKLNIEDHLVARHRSGTATDRDNIRAVLDDASAHVSDVVITAWREIVKMSDRDLTITLGDGVYEDQVGLYLQIRVKEGRQTYYIRERSLGFRWFFGFILFTHFRTYRDNQRENALFLLDEPASNLHPAAQAKLLDAFASLPNKQIVIYSTHSHHMIRPEWLANAFIVKNVAMDYGNLGLRYKADDTRIDAERYYTYVAKHPKDADLFRPVLDALDYRPSLLEMVPDIVVVEGKNDFYTLRLALRELARDGVQWRVYPSTGKDKTEYVVGLYLAWGRNFMVMLDADADKTQKRLFKAFGELVTDRIFTLRDVNPGWAGWAMEDMFDARDKKKLVEIEFPGAEVSKSRLNTAIQSVVLNDIDVAFNTYTRDRFSKLVEFCDGVVDPG